jgi:hypothetical protein
MKRKNMFILATILVVAFSSLSFAAGMSQSKLKLKKGWNLVGSVLNNVQMNNAFNKECVNSIWKWNSDNNTWEIFSPDNNLQQLVSKYQIKQFAKVNAGEGYWVNAKEDAEVYLLGSPPEVTSSLSAASVDSEFADNIDTLDNTSIIQPENVTPVISKLIANSEIVTYFGTVTSVPQIGVKSMNGFKLSTNEGEVTIYGLGPAKLWENAEVDRPIEGDNITVEAFKISLDDGSIRNIAIKITDSDGNTLELRNTDTGMPFWAKGAMGLNKDASTGQLKKKQYKWGKKFQKMQ